MKSKTLASREIKEIDGLIRRIAISLYLQLLECPNLESIRKEVEQLAESEGNLQKIAWAVEDACVNSACNEKPQMTSCDFSSCRHVRRDFKARILISAELRKLIESYIG